MVVLRDGIYAAQNVVWAVLLGLLVSLLVLSKSSPPDMRLIPVIESAFSRSTAVCEELSPSVVDDS